METHALDTRDFDYLVDAIVWALNYEKTTPEDVKGFLSLVAYDYLTSRFDPDGRWEAKSDKATIQFASFGAAYAYAALANKALRRKAYCVNPIE